MRNKRDIYDLDIQGMRGLLRSFSNTLYGRTVFFLAYFVPLMVFLVMIGLVITEMIAPKIDLFFPIVGVFFLFIAVFILGNIYYYHEIRIFAEKRS